MPSRGAPVDLMHNLFGIVQHFHTEVITRGYLLDKKGWDTFEQVLNDVRWPSRFGRLPKNVSEPYLSL